MRGFGVLVSMAVALVSAACGSKGSQAESQYVDDTGAPESSTTTSDLPCDVATVLASCTSCHSDPPTTGTPMPLLTYADLAAASTFDSSITNAQRALARMQDATNPMPPKPTDPASADDIAKLDAWIKAGMPKGNCEKVDAGPNPYDTPTTCTSGRTWAFGDRGSALMHPGVACIDCHKRERGPLLTLAGTVYPSAHEPDDCNSILSSRAVVSVTDSKGKVYNLTVNSAGNFYYVDGTGTFAPPYTVRVKYEGRERAMVTPQSDGDCNSCHTEKGAPSAPGRVMLP